MKALSDNKRGPVFAATIDAKEHGIIQRRPCRVSFMTIKAFVVSFLFEQLSKHFVYAWIVNRFDTTTQTHKKKPRS